VEAGWNALVGCDPERIVEAVRSARLGEEDIRPYGDGRAAVRIVGLLVNYLEGAVAGCPKEV